MCQDKTPSVSLLTRSKNGDFRRLDIELSRSSDGFKITTNDAEFGRISAVGSDYFECLRGFRKRIEADGVSCVCQGARPNVWPSGMAKQMSDGLKAYALKLGEHPTSSDLVDIFADAESDEVGLLHEQNEFVEQWKKSLENA